MHILIGVDGSQAATVACDFVASRTWPIGTRIELVSVVPAPLRAAGDRGSQEDVEALLAERAEPLRHLGMAVSTTVVVGDPPVTLARMAQDRFASLIVVGNRGLGPIGSALIGSVSAHLIDHAPCPVLVVRSPRATRLLLASDGTPSSQRIPQMLATWRPAFNGLPVEVVSVAPPPGMVTPWASEGDTDRAGQHREVARHRDIAQQVVDHLIDLGWHAAGISVVGDPGKEILDASTDWHADLIVTGSRGVGPIRRLLQGSVPHFVMTHARSSVLVMRGQMPANLEEPEFVHGMALA